jgi:WD40 repeat protein
LAERAVQVYSVEGNRLLGSQLAVVAHRLAPTPEARNALLAVESPPSLGTLTRHTGPVSAMAFSDDGKTLATGGQDKMINLWDMTDPDRVQRLDSEEFDPVQGVNGMAFSPNGRILAAVSGEIFRLWDVTDTRQLHIRGGTRIKGGSGVAFSPNENIVAVAEGPTTRLWDVSSPRPQELASLTGHAASVTGVTFAADGKTLATASADRTARLWDVRIPSQPKERAELTGHTTGLSGVAVSPDDRMVATISSYYDKAGRLQLWDVTNLSDPRRVAVLEGPGASSLTAAAFSPNGSTLVTARTNDTAQLWDVITRNEIFELPSRSSSAGKEDFAYRVAFSPDGNTLVAGSYTGNIWLWDTNPADLSKRICDRDGPLSREEWANYVPSDLPYRDPCQ